jgi:uncharacterized membrane protein YbhN (UPF0104 family)
VSTTLRLAGVVAVFALLFALGLLDPAVLAAALHEPGWFLAGAATLLSSYLLAVPRWRTLLAVQGIDVPLGEATRLTFVGLFFSSLIPGAVSGDLVKAYTLTRDRPRKAEAVVSILFDRALGLYSMVALAAISLALIFTTDLLPRASALRDDPRVAALAGVCGGALIGITLAFVLASSARLRDSRLLAWVFERAPLGRTLESLYHATIVYRRQPLATTIALGWSFLGQVPLFATIVLMAEAVGITGMTLGGYSFVLPVGLIVNALPLLPGGLGQAEAAFEWLFGLFGSAEGAEATLLYHLAQILLSLGIGGVALAFGRKRSVPGADEEPGDG